MKHNIYQMVRENREEATSILSTLPNKELKLIEDINWDSIEDGILAEEDAMDNEELRDLPCVVVATATDKLCEVIVLKIFLEHGDIHFYGVKLQGYDNYMEEDIEVYRFSDCALFYDNVLYELVEDYSPKKK